MEAIDGANYLFNDFKIKNVSSPEVPLTITGGWGRDAVTNETITLIDTTGGTIFSNPDLVILVETGGGGGGGASAADVWTYSARTLTTGGVTAIQSGLATEANATANKNELVANIDALPTASEIDALPTASEIATALVPDLTVINENVKKASKLIPATEDL